MQSKISDKWDNYFLQMCIFNAKMSKDPSTKVGAVIVGADREFISSGFNGLPRGLKDTEERLTDRDLKLKLVVHAEMNSVLAAAKLGIKIQDCTMYIAATNGENIWGGPPCSRCLVEILQTGINEIVTYQEKSIPTKWYEDLKFSKQLIEEAGIKYREIQWQN